jgi:hypothetical protein
MATKAHPISALHAGNPAKRQQLFLVLTAFFLTNAVLAEVIGSKIFSLEQLLQVQGAHISIFGLGPYDFNLTAGVLLWPFVFISTDLVNEYFGPQGVRRISWIGVAMIVYMFVMVWLVTRTPPATFWLENNATDSQGRPFNIDFAYGSIFRQGMGIMIGSITAFLLGQLIDSYVFHALRKRTGEKFIWLRATGSTLVSQLLDSVVVLFVAFYLFGNWSLEQVLAVSVVNYIYKFGAALLLTPLLYISHQVVDTYLGKETTINPIPPPPTPQAF